MNDMAKNLLLWLIIAVVLLTVFQSFNPRGTGTQGPVFWGGLAAAGGLVLIFCRCAYRGQRGGGGMSRVENAPA